MKKYSTAFPYFPKSDVDDIVTEIREILEGRKMLTMGEHVRAFENEFSRYSSVGYSVATNSCTSALELSLFTLNLSANDEVIVPVQTFIATGSCVLKSGAKIVFCDVDDDFLLDFEFMKNLVNENTKAVIVVHFAGMISKDILKISSYLKNRNIALIEDSAHALGAMFGKLKAGSIGDFGCFSFFSTKIITTGEGGMITTNNVKYYEKCVSMRSRGEDIKCKEELFVNLGGNYRVTEIQALLGRYQLIRLEEFLEHRNKIASIYKHELRDLIKNKTVRIQQVSDVSRHSYWRFIVFLNQHDRDEIKDKLNVLNIQADAPYSPLLHQQPLFKDIVKGKYPNAEKLLQKHISLPIHLMIKEDDARLIVNHLKEILK